MNILLWSHRAGSECTTPTFQTKQVAYPSAADVGSIAHLDIIIDVLTAAAVYSILGLTCAHPRQTACELDRHGFNHQDISNAPDIDTREIEHG